MGQDQKTNQLLEINGIPDSYPALEELGGPAVNG